MALVRLKMLARAAAVMAVAGGLSACSSAPDWVDPSTWLGDSNNSSSATQLDEQQAQQQADNSQTPDLANVPDKPTAPSTPDEQKQVADSLQQDRTHNQYSGDTLRGGTEAAAAPPGAPPPPSADDVSAAPKRQASATPPPAAPAPAAAPVADQPVPADTTTTADNGSNGAIDATGGPGTGDTSAAPTAAPTRAVASAPMPSSSRGGPAVPAVGPSRGSSAAAVPGTSVASMEAPPMMAPSSSGRMPAVPAVPMNGAVPGAQHQVSDSELGFRPSTAPPLDSSVSQFVPPSIIARYQQTAAVAPTSAAMSNVGGPAVPNTPRGKAMGGPEQMSGAVVANFDSLQAGTAAAPAAVYANTAGLPPTSVVFFPHDTTVLNAAGKSQVRAAVQAFQQSGGQGFIRVVGHSSSRTANMSVQRHLVFNFERSQARANAVARALIAEGVPANKVLVEAVGDAQPVYYESMPQGEDGNRRAEIFVQS
jgi:outer membrane protein OmpA-like peptidoglycan-associated protein